MTEKEATILVDKLKAITNLDIRVAIPNIHRGYAVTLWLNHPSRGMQALATVESEEEYQGIKETIQKKQEDILKRWRV